MRQSEPEPLRATDVEPAIRALLGGHDAGEVEAALGAAFRASGQFDPAGTARSIVRFAQDHASGWAAELERGTHPATVTVFGMVMLELEHRLRADAEEDAAGRLAPVAATRIRLIGSLLPGATAEPPPGKHYIRSREGEAAAEWLDGARLDPVPAIRMLRLWGASKSWAYAFLRDNDLPPDATDWDIPDDILHRALARLQELQLRRRLYDRATVPGRTRRSAYRLRSRTPDVRPADVPAPRRRRAG